MAELSSKTSEVTIRVADMPQVVEKLNAAEKVLQAKVVELEQLREAAMALVSEGCREELGAPTHDKCWKPAEFVLWGKLIPQEGLGPRCYEHAEKHVGSHALAPGSAYALMDLRPVRRSTGLEAR